MSRDNEEVEIGGIKYTFTQFPLKKSMRIFAKLTNILSEPLTTLSEMAKDDPKAKDSDILDAEVDFKVIGKALGLASAKLQDDELYNLLKELCSGTIAECPEEMNLVGGMLSKNFDAHFSKNQSLAFKVALKAVEVNYKDFLGEMLTNVGINLNLSSK